MLFNKENCKESVCKLIDKMEDCELTELMVVVTRMWTIENSKPIPYKELR